jgi:putative iron-regulated protein
MRSHHAWLLVPLSVLVPACGDGSDDAPPPAAYNADTAAQAVQGYAELMHTLYSDNVQLAQALKDEVDDFLAAPDAAGFLACKRAWLAARPYYIQTEAARFYDGPIDGPPDGPEGFVNAWPLDEAHIDYVVGNATAGIINDPVGFPVITEPVIRGANENPGETNISCGWHAIEFLLWGQDGTLGFTDSDSDGVMDGSRAFTDYTGAPNFARRKTYLGLLVQMLVDDLTLVRDQWAPGGAFRTAFLALPVATALDHIMTGMGTLAFGELRGERLLVPFTTKDKEDEHSCFSDTTHLDHLNDILSIRNVWEGFYRSSDGVDHFFVGLRHVALSGQPALAGEVEARISAAVLALESSDLFPFETAVQGLDTDPGRVAIQAALDRLAEFNTAFAALAAGLGISITTVLP